jgi:hypothetical protein
MSLDDLKYRYGILERKLDWLEPCEMTAKELRQALQDELNALIRWYELAARTQARIASIRAQISQPLKEIPGGGKTTPRKRICRIHQWDSITNKRIRGHKHDRRMPSYRGDKSSEASHE